jgi:hypothetical protein
MKLNLPVYQFIIDDSIESGVKAISLVDDPAIMSNFVVFENEVQKPKYFKSDEFEQVVFGIALQPDLPIYRIDQETGQEYYGVFTKETIKKIVQKFHKQLQSNKVNLMHNSNAYIDAYMFNDYIVESDLQIEHLKTKGILDAKIGSWVVAYKIENPKVFQSVLNGDFKGFSVECYLDTVLMPMFRDKILDKKIKKEMKKINRSLKEKILSLFTELEKFTRSLVPELAFEIEWTEVGAPVSKIIVDENGEETLQPVGQGEFVTELGIVVVDEQSNLVEVRELPAEPEVETPEVEEPEMELPEESPEVPIITGDTGTTMGADMDACVADLIAQGKTEEEAWAICQASVNGLEEEIPMKRGIEKTVLEVVGTSDGEYTILVKVEGGIVTSATVQSMTDLMFEKEKEISELKEKNEQLEEKIKEPIGDPILQPETPTLDWNKMTAYEKMMHKKGMNPYYK